MSGKGSAPRPISVDRKIFEDNWEKIFKKTEEYIFWDHYSDLPAPKSYEEQDTHDTQRS